MNNYTAAPPDDPLLGSLLRAARTVQGAYESALGEIGLSAARYAVLDQLAKANAPLALSDLAERLSCVRSNMTQLVDRLEDEGLVRRVADPTDRRSVRADLTAAGRERQMAGSRSLEVVRDQLAARLSVERRDELISALQAFGGQMRR